jgi:dehydrogenase/reductase SDR family protein 4
MASQIDLSGKVALVTGGGRGLGKEMARRLADAGADVAIASRKLDVLEATAAQFEPLAGRVLPVACNVGQADQLQQLVETITAALRAQPDEA